MKRLLRWHLPLWLTIGAAVVLTWGFATALGGGAGRQVVGETDTHAVQPAPRNADQILILGDSLARGAGDDTGRGIGGNLETEIPDAEIVNLGVDGATSRDLIASVHRRSIQRMAAASGTIVVSIGGNDLFRESRSIESDDESTADLTTAIEEIIPRVHEIIQALRTASPEARIFVIGLYDPFGESTGETWRAVTEWNARLALALADDPRTTVVHTSDLFVDHDRLSRDRFHPGAEAYELIARRIADALRVEEPAVSAKGGPASPPSTGD